MDNNDAGRKQLIGWIDQGELRSVAITFRATEQKNRGTSPDPVEVRAKASGLELSSSGKSVDLCCRAILDQLRALAPDDPRRSTEPKP